MCFCVAEACVRAEKHPLAILGEWRYYLVWDCVRALGASMTMLAESNVTGCLAYVTVPQQKVQVASSAKVRSQLVHAQMLACRFMAFDRRSYRTAGSLKGTAVDLSHEDPPKMAKVFFGLIFEIPFV